ncbi:MAG: SMP-30/gluconolactonase/LRE family protein [Deltaproteobacteria bacterium]
MGLIAEGFAFLEGPRWRDGALYFSDMHGHAVFRWSATDGVSKIVDVPTRPSGLGWDNAGRMLIVSMQDRSLLRLANGSLTKIADLSEIATFDTNDMVVDSRGGAYIGNFGFPLEGDGSGTPVAAKLVYVDPQGGVHIVADEMLFPNGSVITPDGKTLIVGETMAGRLSAFDIADDGMLSGRRVWADLAGRAPDGCCLDAEGAVWVASVTTNEFVRIREGGAIVDTIRVDRMAIACTLGGDDGHTLFLLTSQSTAHEESRRLRSAQIETHHVEVPSGNSP